MPSSIWRRTDCRQALDVATKRTVVPCRWAITQKLVDLIHASATPPSVLISHHGLLRDRDAVVTEDEPPHNEFTHKLCARWEQQITCRSAERPDPRLLKAYRRCPSAPQGGILGKMVPPFRPSGSAVQVMVDNTGPIHTTIWSTAFCAADNDSRSLQYGLAVSVHNEHFAHALKSRAAPSGDYSHSGDGNSLITAESPVRWYWADSGRQNALKPPDSHFAGIRRGAGGGIR